MLMYSIVDSKSKGGDYVTQAEQTSVWRCSMVRQDRGLAPDHSRDPWTSSNAKPGGTLRAQLRAHYVCGSWIGGRGVALCCAGIPAFFRLLFVAQLTRSRRIELQSYFGDVDHGK